MTIIFELGDQFWIESHETTVALTDSAGLKQGSDTAVDRAGTCLGYSITPTVAPSNDNQQAVGAFFCVFNDASANLTIGLHIFNFRFRVLKQAGTAGSTNMTANLLLFMRKSG